MEYYCSECKKGFELTEEDLLPGRGTDIVGEDYLLFYAICPECGNISVYEECTSTDIERIPPDMKIRLMRRYAHIADESLELRKAQRQVMIDVLKAARIQARIDKIQDEAESDKCLYDGWRDSRTIVRGLKQRSE